jgi:hypothetical protein
MSNASCETGWRIMNTSEAISRLRQVIRRQHKAISTETSYVYWLRRYVVALQKMPPTLSSKHKIERFLSQLARQRQVSASSQNQALNALVFFYHCPMPCPQLQTFGGWRGPNENFRNQNLSSGNAVRAQL